MRPLRVRVRKSKLDDNAEGVGVQNATVHQLSMNPESVMPNEGLMVVECPID